MCYRHKTQNGNLRIKYNLLLSMVRELRFSEPKVPVKSVLKLKNHEYYA